MSVDVMDALGTPIEIHVRGPEILRIVPRIFPEVNEEWLADKGRQAFDGLKYQRLNTILKRLPDGRLKELTWTEGLQEAVNVIKRVQPEEIQARIGSFADAEAIVSLRDLMHRIGAERIIYAGKNELNHDFRAQYLMGSMIKALNYADILLMVGFNMRTISPVLNARIRRAVTEKKMKVAVIGPGERLLYKYLHLGNSTKTLNELANQSHPFSKVLQNSKLPMIMVSSDVLRRKDGKEIESVLHKLCCDYKVINTETKWNGYNVILKSAAEAGAHEIGLTSNLSEEEMKRPIKLVYLLNADDNLEDIPSDAYVIYQVILMLSVGVSWRCWSSKS
jgi:NADH dehydrogenase/NADH:ubiquinone oxidoreductase subunit G